MAKLQIGDKTVEVDDSFLKLSASDQQKTVDEIQKSFDGSSPKHYDWADVPAAALKNAPADASQVVSGIASQALDELPKSLAEVPKYALDKLDLVHQAKIAGKQIYDTGKHLYDAYGSVDAAKTSLAEHPVQAALDAATVVPVAKGLSAAGKGVAEAAASANKLKVTYPEAAASVAQDLKSSGHDISTFDGANKAVSGAHTNIKTEIKAQRPLFKDQLDPNAPDLSDAEVTTRMDANKGLDAAFNKASTQATPDQIDALDSLVGDTKQGAQLVHNLKKHVEVQRINNNPKGGVSQYTDELMPGLGGRLGVKHLAGNAITGTNILHAAVSPSAASLGLLGAQMIVPAVGRGIDAITGRRLTAAKLVKDFGNKAPPDVGAGLTDVVAQKAAADAALKRAADDAQAQRDKAAADKLVEKLDTKQAKTTYSEALEENKRRDAVTKAANDKIRAQAALEKQAAMTKQAQEDAAYKQASREAHTENSRLSAVAKEAQRRQKAQAALQKQQDRAAAQQAKAAEKEQAQAAKAPKRSYAPKAGENATPRNQALYEAGVARVKGQEAEVSKAIEATGDKHLKKLLSDGLDMFSNELKGPKNHKNRVLHFTKLLQKAKTKHQRSVLHSKLKPLAETFRASKK